MPITHVAVEAAPMPYDSPLPMVHSLGSDEGSLTLNKLTVLCTSLSKKVEILESDLNQTKQTYGAAYTKLIMKDKYFNCYYTLLAEASLQDCVVKEFNPEEVARREVISPPVSKISAKDKASKAAIYDEMDNIPDMIKADEQLAARFQAEEQELYSIKEKSRLLVEIIAERKRFFAAQRAAEQRSKHNYLKEKSYEEIQKLFDKTYKQVNSFVPMASDDKEKGNEKKTGGSRKKTLAKKRAGEKQSEKSSKRQKMEDDVELYRFWQKCLDLKSWLKKGYETASSEGIKQITLEENSYCVEQLILAMLFTSWYIRQYTLTQEKLTRSVEVEARG
ncbi:hypothetical protein Tco_0530436 [Tanacetum coccineum]